LHATLLAKNTRHGNENMKSLCATLLVENIRKGVGHKNENVKTHHCNAPTSFLKTPKMK
jgi:hypothetical protein